MSTTSVGMSSTVPTGNRSPDTIGPSYSKDVTYTGEVMGNYANGSVGESYGIFDIDKIQFHALRTSAPAMCIVLSRMEFSAAVGLQMKIPTGRSPRLNSYSTYDACYVKSDGSVGYGIRSSCGIQ